jgi:membrane protein YdbS with pleckstrin-like domain
MAYPDELLVEGERVVTHQHPHWKKAVLPVLALLLVVGSGSYLAALTAAQPWATWAWVALAGLGLALVVWLTVIPVIRWRTTHFVVTTRRVLVREGVLTRHGMDIPMSRINSVQFRHNLLERLLGCGTLVIESASDEALEFDDIPHVERVYALLYREVADEA